VAGLLAATSAGEVDSGQTIAITVTGHGLKDIDTALRGAGALVDAIIEADVDAAAAAAGLV
jgi:threonine synthase